MDDNLTFHRSCPVCGEVKLGPDSFAAASYGKDGAASITFYCPKCSSPLTIDGSITREKAIAIACAIAKSADRDEVSAQRPKVQDPGIRYTALRPGSLFNIDMKLTPKTSVSAVGKQVPLSASKDEDLPGQGEATLGSDQWAMMEYFHRQLESLDTVDEAIEEIETGYNMMDDDGQDDEDDR